MGSGLKGVVGGYARGKPKIKRDCNQSNQWNLRPQVFEPCNCLRMIKLKLWYHFAGLPDSPLFQVMSRKRYEIFHSSSTLRNDQ